MGNGLDPVTPGGTTPNPPPGPGDAGPDTVGEAPTLEGESTSTHEVNPLDQLTRLATDVSAALTKIFGDNKITLRDMGLNGKSGITKESSIMDWGGFDGRTAGFFMLPADLKNPERVSFEVYMPRGKGPLGFGSSDSKLGKLTEGAVSAGLVKANKRWSTTPDLQRDIQLGLGSNAKGFDRLIVAVTQLESAPEQ